MAVSDVAAQAGGYRVAAPAKLNLYLHVVGKRPDGYHLLDSLIAFSEAGDSLAAWPAEGLSLCVEGPMASVLTAETGENLVLKAARLLAEMAGVRADGALTLIKRLPVAAGIGGGSADAAAALRLLCRLWDLDPAPEDMRALALRLGADVPVCLLGRPAWVSGVGEGIEPLDRLPAAALVLVNPMRPLSTPEVFRARQAAFSPPGRFTGEATDAAQLAQLLAASGNDLTEPAIRLLPVVADMLATLAACPGCLLPRMSGSGATCFGLFATPEAAEAAADFLRHSRPEWWSVASHLLSAPPVVEALV